MDLYITRKNLLRQLPSSGSCDITHRLDPTSKAQFTTGVDFSRLSAAWVTEKLVVEIAVSELPHMFS